MLLSGIAKHVKHSGFIRAFCLLGGTKFFSTLGGGTEKIAGLHFLCGEGGEGREVRGFSNQADTMSET